MIPRVIYLREDRRIVRLPTGDVVYEYSSPDAIGAPSWKISLCVAELEQIPRLFDAFAEAWCANGDPGALLEAWFASDVYAKLEGEKP